MQKRVWITWETQRRSIELSKITGCKLYIIEYKGFFRYPASILKTINILRRTRPNVLFIQNPSMILASLVCIYKLFNKITLIIDRHTTFLLDKKYKNSPGIILFKLLNRFTIMVADLTIVTNSSLAKIIEKTGGLPYVLPDPLPEIKMNDKKKLQGKKNIFLISSFGIDEPINEVLKAAKEIDKSIYIYISGNYAKLDKSLVQSAPSNIKFTGFLSELEFNTMLFSVDAVMVLTTADSCMLCGCYEAISVSKPLITSGKKDLKEYFTAAVFVNNKAKGISDGIKEVFANWDDYKQNTIFLKKKLSIQWNINFNAFESEVERIHNSN